jgi:gluconate 2-dehydrogenase alpha chain
MIKHKETEVVIIGSGWTGGILASELSKAGVPCVMLERGHYRDTSDWQHRDELRYAVRGEIFQDYSVETMSLRHNLKEKALPIRYLGNWLPGTDLGGASVHWNGQTWRLTDHDFQIRSETIDRYGASFIPEDMTIRDWGLDAATLEPYYTKFEAIAGIAGKAGNIKGKIQPGGNPFESPRSKEYPVKEMPMAHAMQIFKDATDTLGYHPFTAPSANLPVPYKNPDGVVRASCAYCGYCPRYGCETGAKASSNVTVLPVAQRHKSFELRTEANVFKIQHDGKKATGVLYYDAAGEVHEQPADIVIVGAFMFNNVRLLLLSDMGKKYDPVTGKGVIGRNFAYQSSAGASGWMNERLNKWIGSGALGESIDDFYGDNFDHSGLGFIGGGNISCSAGGEAPIQNTGVPAGSPAWGSGWKKAMAESFDKGISAGAQLECVSYKWRSVDLDPTYRDAMGHPLLRVTFDWADNERKMAAYLAPKCQEIVQAMGAKNITASGVLPPHFDTVAYQTTHVTGGAIMGTDPSETAVNTWTQMWDFPNTFVIGSSAFPQNAGKNPTGTVGALAYRLADGIINHYRKRPGHLISA